MNREFLKELLGTLSVSGHEEDIQKKALAFGKDFAHQQLTDPVGNVINVVNPQAEHKVLLCGHIDEIGFVVTHIDESGIVHVTRCGGVRAKLYIGSQMLIKHEGRLHSAVVCVNKGLLKKDDVEAEDLLLDVGARTREEAEQAAAVGDPVCADVQPIELLNDCLSCRGMDDRTGAFIVLEAARLAAEKGAKMGIYAATTVGEETSMRGAYYAGARVKPDCALAIDVTWANDYPGSDPASTGFVKVGEGPVICLGSTVNKKLNGLLKRAAEKNGVKVQWEVATGRTGTDGDVVNTTGCGVPMALVSIPLRYMHSSVEVGSWKDLEGCIELVADFILELEQALADGLDFSPLA